MIFSKLFHPKAMSIFNLRQCCKFTIPLASSIYSGIESIPYLGTSPIWTYTKEIRCFQIFYEKLTALKLSALIAETYICEIRETRSLFISPLDYLECLFIAPQSQMNHLKFVSYILSKGKPRKMFFIGTLYWFLRISNFCKFAPSFPTF